MEVLDLEGNKQLIAFSDQSLEESSRRVDLYTRQMGRDIDLKTLTAQVEPELLTALGEMIDIRAEIDISAQSTDLDVDTINEEVHKNISLWDEKLKKILVVTFIDKILRDIRFASKNISENLLKRLYYDGYDKDLSFIYFYTFREKLKRQR